MKINTCCFIGHRIINETEELKTYLQTVIEDLIISKNVAVFLFGSKSRFNDLCHEIITEAKEKHPHIKRIYVRAEYPDINESYKEYLLRYYEDTYYPETLTGCGKSVYIKRNLEMIKNSDFCVIYYDEHYAKSTGKSGTKKAVEQAVKLNKTIIKIPVF